MQKRIIHAFLIFSMLMVSQKSSGEVISTDSDSNSSCEDLIVPTNRMSSVQYLLYTPKNPTTACYIEAEASVFTKCAFNTSYETIFIIHGYEVKLLPGNLFVIMKDTLLEYDKYNVIIVNWTKYNQQSYPQAMVNAYDVGGDVANTINFITSYTGISATSIYTIGHSLGAHIAGVAGKNVTNLGRITGLDPAAPGYSVEVTFNRLTSTDAEFVDAIHTSNGDDGTGYGMVYPMAVINFYPNGGQTQPMCQFGKTYYDCDGEEHKILTPADESDCCHDSAVQYFISSILDCEYLSTQCSDYITYERGLCKPPSDLTDRMGFHCVEIQGVQDHSTFYVDTSGNSPFC